MVFNPPNIDAIYEKLCMCIVDKDAEKLKALLQTDFIYPGRLNVSYHPVEWVDGERYGNTYETWNTRPIVEALFVDKISCFTGLIDKLIEANDPTLYQAFLDSRTNTDLDNDSLFKWNQTIQNKIQLKLNQMRTYGNSLIENEDSAAKTKGQLAVSVAESLLKQVKEKSTEAQSPADQKMQFENLKFKVDLVKELYQHAETFDKHREWKKLIVNFFSILFTAAIANLINYAATGNFLFLDKTQTKQNALNTQEAMGFSDEPVNPDKLANPDKHVDPEENADPEEHVNIGPSK